MKPALITAALAMMALGGCAVTKTAGTVASLPFKGVYYTGKGVYHTGKFAANTVYQTGKGLYYVGRVPVQITDKALDTSTKVLTVTTQAVDLSGKVITVSRQIQASELEGELAALKGATHILKVVVDAAR